MQFQFKLKVHAPKAAIWPYYADPEKRYIWEEDLEQLTFAGAVAEGTTGTMKLKGMPELAFTLTKIVDQTSYWDRTDVPGVGSLHFGHDIVQDGEDIYICHSVGLESDHLSAEDLPFLTQVFADVPKAVFKIKEEAEAQRAI
ncbi:MAG: polyketide cyclase [Sporolactobacillus sp.]